MNRCRVTVASNMSEETYRYICDSFVKKFGETEFTKLVDDSILGGFILSFGSGVYDLSIATQLKLMGKELKQ